ncbi:MAG: periplasmic divalent cation tolerance protein [Thermoanaerobaculia bacterium]|jgi:periplasmic divalent cation tolerance protein|nr:periplasmic divalent cation tolerance protein [Thermoanaerobaculia bacterium]
MAPVIVLTSVAADFDARPFARELVEQRLAACVNIVPGVMSIFRWKGSIEEDPEQLLVIKTLEENVDALRDAILARHPYEVAEFLVLPVASTSDAYGAWLLESASR